MKRTKILVLLLSLLLVLASVFGGTFAQLITGTPSIINTFLSGLIPTGDLVIRKVVAHPFGESYTIPDDLSFDFEVSLGEEYAGKTVETSQGDTITDENGDISLSIPGNGMVCIQNLPIGTEVTVTEADKPSFTPEEGAEKSIVIQSEENTLHYINHYEPEPVNPVNVTVSGTKILEGRDWQEGDSFTFLLEYKLAGEDWQSVGTASVAYDPDNADFDKFYFTDLIQNISYTSAGVYAFRMSEIAGSLGGITYDKVISYFDILVGDADMDGSLEVQNVTGYQNAAASYDESEKKYHVDVTVQNWYAPEGTATALILIEKQVDSNSGEAKTAAGYTFEVYDEDGSLVETSEETSAAGQTSLELTFDAEDAGSSFHYTLVENHSGETIGGMTYDDTVHPITVTVVDNLDGTISAYIYDTDRYETEEILLETEETAEVTPEETELDQQEVGNIEPVSDVLVEISSEPVPQGSVSEDITLSAEETDTFEEIPEEEEENNDDGDFYSEEEDAEDQSAEPETREVVIIPDDADNHYEVTFVNVYDPEDATVSLEGTKVLTGRSLREGEFSFSLYAADNSFEISQNMEPVTAVNDESGNFKFTIDFDKVGTYRYVVKEDISEPLGGVTYDGAIFYLLVTVTDDNGVLKATTSITDELGAASEIQFENIYRAAATSVTFTGTKTLTGAELKASMFRFCLYSADENYEALGTVLASAVNDAAGNFAFESIRYSDTGTFYYVVKEDASAAVDGMTYDGTTYGIRVVVTDDGMGRLNTSVRITERGADTTDAIVFENRYIKPTDPSTPTVPSIPTDPSKPTDPSNPTDANSPSDSADPTESTNSTKPTKPSTSKVPATSDENPIGFYIALVAISVVAIVILLVTDEKRKDRHPGE